MEELRVYLFGEPRARFGDGPYLKFPTAKALELLAFAALNGEAPIPRNHIASALREDTSDSLSRRALSTDIWRLRKLFTDAGQESDAYLIADRRSIGIQPDAPLYLDVVHFEQVADRVASLADDEITRADADALAEAVDLFEDDLLVSLDQEWCFLLREKLRAKHLAALDRLMQFEMTQDDWARALQFADRLIEADALLEHAHRAAMQCHFLMGNRGAAIRQYARCADCLDRELGILPSEDTQRMHRGLLSVQLPAKPTEPVHSGERARPSQSVLGRDRPLTDQLSMALNNLDNARVLVENVDTRLRRDRASS